MKKAAALSILVVVILIAVAGMAQAQQPGKIPRIGYLAGASSAAIAFRIGAFRQGLRELGYVEGKNITIEYRYAEGNLRRQESLRLNWRVSTWMLSSLLVQLRPVPPGKQPVQYPLS